RPRLLRREVRPHLEVPRRERRPRSPPRRRRDELRLRAAESCLRLRLDLEAREVQRVSDPRSTSGASVSLDTAAKACFMTAAASAEIAVGRVNDKASSM